MRWDWRRPKAYAIHRRSIWDADDVSQAWTKRFLATQPRAPTMLQAGAYGAALHYLKAVASAGTLDTKAVMD